jgi:uncharacterized membrane protein
MFEGMIGTIVVVALIVAVTRMNSRLRRLEREIGTIRDSLKNLPATNAQGAVVTEEQGAGLPVETPEKQADVAADQAAQTPTTGEPEASGPWGAPASPRARVADKPEAAEPVAPVKAQSDAKGSNFETALGTRWAVWVGGIALALGGLFLIRYSIEAGIFGPGVRLTMAGLLGVVLLAAGEFVRRRGFNLPVKGATAAYVPGILTEAGSFTLFGAIYAAHGVYGFIGPALAFALLGIVGIGAIAAALVHGQALAGLGLLGSLITPLLVSSQSPNAWALFGYLAIVLAANTAIARIREWKLIASAGFLGVGIWCLLYLGDSGSISLAVVMFINVVVLGCCAILWLRDDAVSPATGLEAGSGAAALAVALAAISLIVDPRFEAGGGAIYGGILIVLMILVAFYRRRAIAMVHAAGAATVLICLRAALSGTFLLELPLGTFALDGLPEWVSAQAFRPVGIGLALAFLTVGFWRTSGRVAAMPRLAAEWAAWATLVPLAVLVSQWATFGNLDRDLGYAAAALLLAAVLAAAGEATARREAPALTGGLAVSFALAGAAVATALMLHMAFGPLWTTILAGAAAVVPALATRIRGYSILGWLCVGAAAVVLARVAIDPTIVGASALGKTPVFNALLPAYGIPAVAFGFAAWQLSRTSIGRPQLVMQAMAILFGMLALGMLVRHAMNGGVINSDAPSLAEQAIYTLIALGAGAILIALDMRSPSSVLRIGSIAVGVLSVTLIIGQHFIILNPLLTNESTGTIPVFNLLFLAYLLPAIAAGALAFYARGKRPTWYSAMLGFLASALAFVYATLSVRRLFQGEHIGFGAGMGQIETYSYSALWLAMGAALLVAGVLSKSQVLRLASAGLISIAVAKVFIFDMSELEGVLRALSFIGLGAVLIGIGLFYQKLLARTAKDQAVDA